MEKYCFGVDVGGTSIKIGLFTEFGKLLQTEQIPTDKTENGKNIIEHIANKIKEIISQNHLEPEQMMGVGIGLPGPVTDEGVVLGCVNLGWQTMTMDSLSEKLYGTKIYPLNDANAATLGEMWQGGGIIDGKMCKNIAFVTLGTGVGGGIVAGGHLLYGANGGAGEIGHFPVNSHETECCTCGKKGCLEQYCSATGAVRIGKKILASYGIEAGDITAKDIFDRAKAGQKEYLEIVDTFGRYLAKGCAYIASATNPEIIVIGGGVSMAGHIIIEAVNKYFKTYAFGPCSNVKFVFAKLGNDSGMYGGAYTVIEKHLN